MWISNSKSFIVKWNRKYFARISLTTAKYKTKQITNICVCGCVEAIRMIIEKLWRKMTRMKKDFLVFSFPTFGAFVVWAFSKQLENLVKWNIYKWHLGI